MRRLSRFGVRRSQSDAADDREPDAQSLQKLAEATAVRLLARREHSVEELRRKLVAKGHPEAAVEGVVEKLAAKRLVSNERFTASFLHHHAQRGQGPIRIRVELRQQGIADDAIEASLDSAGIDWVSQAQAVRRRKFGDALPTDRSERAKQARFLQYRGFSSDQVWAALKSDVPIADTDAGLDPDLGPDFQ